MTTYVDQAVIELRLGGNVQAAQKAGVTDALLSACTAIDVHCGQTFSKDTSATARTYTPLDTCTAYTDPFWDLTGLVIKSDSGDDGTFASTWVAADYELDYFGGDWGMSIGAPWDTVRSLSGLFSTSGRRRRTLQVTAKWGWAAVPQNVVEATKILTVDLWKRKDVPFGIATGSVDFGGLRIGRDVMAQCASLLERFVRVDRTVGIA